MLRKIIPVSLLLFIAIPFSVLAAEQSFTQNGLKTTVKLSPDEIVPEKKVNMALKLEKDGQAVTDRNVSLEVYEKDMTVPVLKREVALLDDEYVDSWSFDKTGDYKVVVSIADPGNPAAALHYEVKATVGEAKTGHDGHEEHGFLTHHFGGKWGWWGAGLMVLIMVPLMIVGL